MVKPWTLVLVVAMLACQAPDAMPERSATEGSSVPALDTATSVPQQDAPPTGWVLPDTTRWSVYWWTEYRDSTGTLAARKADLDGDGVADKAAVVEQAGAGAGRRQAVWVHRASGADTVMVIEGSEAELDTLGFGLLIQPPGDIDHLGSDTEEIPSPFHSAQPALSVMYFEKSEVTYVWMKGRFHPVWTGD